MSDLCSKINDIINEYHFLCDHFNEKIQYKKDYYGNYTPDIFSEHFKKLAEKLKKEID